MTTLFGRFLKIREVSRGPARVDYLVREMTGDKEHVLTVIARGKSQRTDAVIGALRQPGLRSPNVVPVSEVLDSDGEVGVLCDTGDAVTLRSWLMTRGVLTLGDVEGIVGAVCTGLSAFHAAGLPHGNLHPSNIFRRLDGTMQLGLPEFGTAESSSERPLYASPGAALNAEHLVTSDLFAVGVLSAELLAWPPPGDEAAATAARPDVALENLLARMTARSDVSPAAKKLVGDLTGGSLSVEYASAATVAAALSGTVEKVSTWRSRRPVLAGAAIATVALAVVAVWALGGRPAATSIGGTTAPPASGWTDSASVPAIQDQLIPGDSGRAAASAGAALRGKDSALKPIPRRIAGLDLASEAMTLAPGERSTIVINTAEGDRWLASVPWRSADTSIATVDITGAVRARAIGQTTVDALIEGRVFQVRVSVARAGAAAPRAVKSAADMKAAIAIGDRDELEQALRGGADANGMDGDGTPLLHLAVRSGRRDIVELLVLCGAALDRKWSGASARQLAENESFREIATQLGRWESDGVGRQNCGRR